MTAPTQPDDPEPSDADIERAKAAFQAGTLPEFKNLLEATTKPDGNRS